MHGQTVVYHITDVTNLPAILAAGGLRSDRVLAAGQAAPSHTVVGYQHIKARRMYEYRVRCCAGTPFVGDFVPFYYCPRSVMLYTINAGRTGRPVGCQGTIVHLVTTIDRLLAGATDWAISDGNAGAKYASFFRQLEALDDLDWTAIRSRSWGDRSHQKAAEFLVKDFVPWTAIQAIGCHNPQTALAVQAALAPYEGDAPVIEVKPNWYFP